MTVTKFSVNVMPIEAPMKHKAQAKSCEVEATTGPLHPASQNYECIFEKYISSVKHATTTWCLHKIYIFALGLLAKTK
jgi:hypothetical protein